MICYGKDKIYNFTKNYDIIIITGGASKTGVGGILLLWWSTVTVVYIFYWIDYLVNRNIVVEFKENQHFTWNSSFDTTYQINIMLYTSTLMDKDGNRNSSNLCAPANVEVITSEYFQQNEDIFVNCDSIVLDNNQNVKYFYSIRLQNVKQATKMVQNESIVFRIKTGPQQVFHFYNYQFYTVWDTKNVYMNDTSMNFRNHTIREVNRGKFYY